MGVAPNEYAGGAAGAGRIHIFTGTGGASTTLGAVLPSQGLWDSTTDLLQYDLVMLSCEGQENASLTAQNRQSLFDYTAAGGRVFASHFHYDWFGGPGKNAPGVSPDYASASGGVVPGGCASRPLTPAHSSFKWRSGERSARGVRR